MLGVTRGCVARFVGRVLCFLMPSGGSFTTWSGRTNVPLEGPHP